MCHDDEDIIAASGGGSDDDGGGGDDPCRCPNVSETNDIDDEQQEQRMSLGEQEEQKQQQIREQGRQQQICDSNPEEMDAEVENDDDDDEEEEEEDEDDENDDSSFDNLIQGVPTVEMFLEQQKKNQQQVDHLSNSSNESQSNNLTPQQQQHHQQQQQQLSHQNHIQLLRSALEKLDPDKNGLALVPKEITSSTLTTRLKGVCRINRLIDHSNDLCHSFTEIGAQAKYQESINKFRDWIIRNKIIEHIFGPNCHVEIIKQSHSILNFVAYSLNDEHVNVIWSASLLKHCGRQVLDLLTSLIRYMRTGPVLHLYWLVKNLSVEDHSEHTLLLTSHILRFIWSHSPCINQLQFCNLQKSRHVSALAEDEDDDENSQINQHHFEQRQQYINSLTPMDAEEIQWLQPWKNNEFLDNTSDVSACCSEEKNMGDFDDDAQGFTQDENTLGVDSMDVNSTTSASDLFPTQHPSSQVHHQNQQNNDTSIHETQHESSSRLSGGNGETSNKAELLEVNDSNDEASRGSSASEAKHQLHPQNIEHYQHHQQLPLESITQFMELKKASYRISCITESSADTEFRGLSEYNLISLSDPGKTVLWDLLQDGKIEHLAPSLYVEIENVFVNLVMSFGDRYIRYKFIEACLENLSNGTSVILSLRLLPKLLSFNTITRNVPAPAINETHTIVLWAEREYNMSQNFFKSLVDYYDKRQQQQQKFLLSSKEQLSSLKAPLTEQQQQQLLLQQQQLLEMGYEAEHCKGSLFSHIDRIITRMSFLTFIYSRPFSPDAMRLSREQLDQLWDCLTSDSNVKCSDVLFQWIYQQSMSDDFHGLNAELFDYVLNHKLPSLEPEHFRLRGLKLLEQLMWNKQEYECCHGLENPATRLLWDIGLKAKDDEVSMAAIRILNHFYIYSNHNNSLKCDKGINFMSYCMNQLHSSLTNLTSSNRQKEDEDYIIEMNHLLDVMQKVILLIRTHLEVFRAHWSFYLRILQLNNEADLISHRLNAYEIKLTMTIRLVCQAASTMDKTTIEVQAGDFVGELRAEIVRWWYTQVDHTFFEHNNIQCNTVNNSDDLLSPTSSSSSTTSNLNKHPNDNDDLNKNRQDNYSTRVGSPSKSSFVENNDNKSLNAFTEFLLANRHSLRLLSHNQEIPYDWDERQINELDIKDMQVIYVLNEVKPTTNSDPNVDEMDESNKSNESAQTNYLPKTEIPSILLLRYEYFERLMEADRFLGLFHSKNNDLTNRAKTLSRRVWEIIQILPTCPNYKDSLKRCGIPGDDWRLKTPQCSNLLSAECPQRLLYSLQIIDILKSSDNPSWGTTFIRKGGLADIFDVFMSQKLLPDENEDWNEWLQECLAYLLKLLFQFGTKPIIPAPPSLSSNDSQSSSSSTSSKINICGMNKNIMINNSPGTSIKKVRRNRTRLLGIVPEDRLPIPLFSDELLKLLSNTDQIFDKLIRILNSSAFCNSQSDQYYYVTMSSRAMIVHHVMSFLSSWCKSDRKFPRFHIGDYEQLLKALILDDTDASTRREACNGFFKLHHSFTTSIVVRNNHNSTTLNTSIDSIYSTINTSVDSSTSEMNTSCNNKNLSTQFSCDWSFSADLLTCLIKFLPIAEAMKPPKPIKNYVSENDYIKELNSPGCKDYFWLTCRLIDSPATMNISTDKNLFKCTNFSPDIKQGSNVSPSSCSSVQKAKDPKSSAYCSIEEVGSSSVQQGGDQVSNIDLPVSQPCSINLFELCQYLVVAIRNRETYETRDFSVEDDTLRGMLLMMVMALRRDPTFRYTNTAFEFVHELYEYLFAPPNQTQRYLPKCKAPATRSTAFDLMIALVDRSPKNYFGLLELLLYDQHNSVVKGTYPTDYWPHDDCRSEVGFVGLINLGATCYLATCMQHLFMIPNLRYAILSIEDTKNIRHGEIIRELQKIFTFMLESERKAYNPRNFCKVYTMDNHPLNIAEQTDMTEFLTDLITKLEESSPELRQIIKELFSGTLSNNVVSLDCPHISRTTEEFYTLRVQVADMRNLNDSLDELTVKDTLEGDNMYTCSTCEKKVRAEKRACIVKLPRILCFNTMRYTFNMATMTKEKVNTHFSFPSKLDMSDYLEKNLMKRQQLSSNFFSSKDSSTGSSGGSSANGKDESLSSSSDMIIKRDEEKGELEDVLKNKDKTSQQQSSTGPSKFDNNSHESPVVSMESTSSNTSPQTSSSSSPKMQDKITNNDHLQESDTIYELIGVTVHTGNADGGHYYCFIRDCEDQTTDKPRWYLFNDAEVKPFDDSHIGAECYGGELTTKSYDAINDRFMDFSIEKTNSAYMLFYKRIDYKYRSRSVAQRYLESDTQRSTIFTDNINLSCEKDLHTDRKQHELGRNIEKDDKKDTVGSTSSDRLQQHGSHVSHNKHSPTRGENMIVDCERTKYQKLESKSCYKMRIELDFNELCQRTYEDFKLPKYLANWIWTDNMKFARDKSVFEHNYFNFMWQVCGNLPRTLNNIPDNLNTSLLQQHASGTSSSTCQASEDVIAIRTVHLAIAFVLGVLMNSRERPNLSNWTELIRKQFNSSKAACDWLMHLIDDEETWLKQMLLKCPIEMVRQLFQRLCNDLTGSKQHKKLRLIR